MGGAHKAAALVLQGLVHTAGEEDWPPIATVQLVDLKEEEIGWIIIIIVSAFKRLLPFNIQNSKTKRYWRHPKQQYQVFRVLLVSPFLDRVVKLWQKKLIGSSMCIVAQVK